MNDLVAENAGEDRRQLNCKFLYFNSLVRPISNIYRSDTEENIECPDIFKSQPGPVAKNATLGHPAGNRTRDRANLMWCSVNWATKAFAKNMAASSVFIIVVMPIRWRVYSIEHYGVYTRLLTVILIILKEENLVCRYFLRHLPQRSSTVECKCHHVLFYRSESFMLPFSLML